MTPLDVLPLMGLFVGVGVAIDSAEVLVSRRALAADGLYSWTVLGAGRRYLVSGPLAWPLGRLFRYPAVMGLPVIQLVAATILISAIALPSGPQRAILAAAALTAGAARMLFYMRQQLGLDGADQMFGIVLLSTGLGAAFGNSAAGWAFTCYAALQLVLSYWVAGFSKAISPQWRSGQAMIGITGTIGYGQQWVHALLSRYPAVSRAICWQVILFECLSPFLILAGVPGAIVMMVVGMGFHIGVAVVMGLNNFVWAFGACYPAVFLLAGQLGLFH